MEKIDWDKAPKWANVILEHECVNGRQCWAESFNHLAKAKNTSSGSEFPLDARMWRIISERPSPAWSGEGLPPVGVECEHLEDGKGGWKPVRVIAIDRDLSTDTAYIVYHGDNGYSGDSRVGLFRPIRTPEQIAADERASALHMAICDVEEKVAKWNTTIDCTAAIKATIDAMISLGYRKQDAK